ncbi:PREDICTED: sodium-independent sulfate anion transporter-like isoform X2 [Bactrocera latifrons]|uniref:sodium-independent sulfate anion transporter-like isoform X2 n=1 Tax=Bactrocera latifrons TaxID=174628 RepID=UPI0008DDB910|nr:PREDICTED: sodium-independent sulfate anion transporter-like isoform X2 [Bactrocera latifrons]
MEANSDIFQYTNRGADSFGSSEETEGLYEQDFPNIRSTILNSSKKLCRPATLTNKLPILKWLPRYQPSFVFRDAIAGFTVGLTTIPQAIAYGVVAGLQPQYGLYAAFMGCFTYIIFGSCKDVTIATTAIMALMVHDYAVITPDLAVLISFLAGCTILVLGILNLGVLVRFISMPVITGFTMAAACTIGSAQINNLFGMKSPSNDLIPAWKHFFTHLPNISLNDALLGVGGLIFLLLMKQVKNIPYGNKTFWKYISLSRNALVVIFGTFLAYQLSRDGSQPFVITGNITAGLPPFRPPPFSTIVDGKELTFSDMISTYGSSLASIPLVSILEIVAIAKAFSKGKIVNASQEMIALGMCNIMGSFVSSMPVTGSFTRTAVNNASGVKTPLGGAVTGAMVLMALAFLTQTFYYIPKATLASVIIAAMISLVELERLAEIWKSKRMDLFPFAVTYFTCLFWSLEYGIICGIVVNISFILYRSARPQIHLEKKKVSNYEICFVDVKQRLDFASAEYLKERVVKFMSGNRYDVSLIVIKGEEINSIDYTVAMNIISLKEDLEVLSCDLVCWNWNIRAAGVVCRLNGDLCCLFKNDHSIEEVVNNYYLNLQRKNESSIDTVCTSTS